MTSTWTRPAAILLAAVLCADLAGIDCSRLAADPAPCSAPFERGDAAGSESPDCLCCLAAEDTAGLLPTGGADRLGSPCHTIRSTTVDGVRPVPYRPPLSARPRPVR